MRATKEKRNVCIFSNLFLLVACLVFCPSFSWASVLSTPSAFFLEGPLDDQAVTSSKPHYGVATFSVGIEHWSTGHEAYEGQGFRTSSASETARGHLVARMYDPADGRFISRDPIGFEGSPWNLYEYVQSNALLYIDPSGEVAPWVVAVLAIGGRIAYVSYRSYRAYRRAKQAQRRALRASQAACSAMYATYKAACGLARKCSTKDCPKDRATKIAKINACIAGRKAFEAVHCCHVRQLFLREFNKPGAARSIRTMNARANRCSNGHQTAIRLRGTQLSKCKTMRVASPPNTH